MSSVVEDAVKVLVDFEGELEKIKQQAVEARKGLVRTAADEGEKAAKEATARVRAMAEERIRKAREEAEKEASSIVSKGEGSLKALRDQISKRNAEAVDLVVKRLLAD